MSAQPATAEQKRATSSRRGFIKKVGGTLGAAGFGTALASTPVEASHTTISISNLGDYLVEYSFIVNAGEIEQVPGWNESSEFVFEDINGDYRAVGDVNPNDTDKFTFTQQIKRLNLNTASNSGDVRVVCENGFAYTGDAAVDLWTDESHIARSAAYEFCVEGGTVRPPGDGSLENNDEPGTGCCDFLSDNCANGALNGGHDHYNTEGRLKKLRVQFGGDYTFHFVRNIGDTW